MAAGIAPGSDYSQLRKWRARQWQAEAGLQKRLSLHNHDHDYYFELRCEGSGRYACDLLRDPGDFRALPLCHVEDFIRSPAPRLGVTF